MPLTPCESRLTGIVLLRLARGGPCAGCAAQEITPSASPWRGRRCRPCAIRSQCGRHGGAESTHAGKNAGAGACRREGDQELQRRIHSFLQRGFLGPPALPTGASTCFGRTPRPDHRELPCTPRVHTMAGALKRHISPELVRCTRRYLLCSVKIRPTHTHAPNPRGIRVGIHLGPSEAASA